MSHTEDGEPLLAVDNLRTVFHSDREEIRAVDGVSFEIARGETLGIVGESGSGKSVTARSIMGLVESPGEIREESSIRLDGRELTALSEKEYRSVRGGDIAMVFQDPLSSLNPVYTVGNQIIEALELHRDMEGAEAKSEAIELLRAVGIPDAARRVDEFPHEFSGGMRQRAVIAMALACDPDLLICDEPTTALDVTIQAQILDLLQEIQTERDIGIMFITHDMGVIAEVADRVAVMYAGEVVEQAPVKELFANPHHPYTQGLLQSIPGRNPSTDRLPTIEGDVPTPHESASFCRFVSRCPKGFDECERVHPAHVEVGDSADHTAACLLYPEDMPTDDTVTQHEANADQTGAEADEALSADDWAAAKRNAGEDTSPVGSDDSDARADGGHGHSAGDTGGHSEGGDPDE
ncbi:ABC transporter ATP-binding protein [Haloarcula marismortui]|uniref:Nickel import system ATP-binding protein NikD n=1 Tax=Haloarcula marismortui ATCC 33800 TaxID=662476 RepID=M0JWX3_9EURY|nr:ABC transporter ATP-binding protein [Haloarcula sinaiiensis]EMA12903.1 oligopeptide ABC transporter ATPase [Haloarcula sinaiiensis ATCC 33800]QUJ71211.1 ABC transporter ATP-binding protein [Haloarcula sinaiiensis ATCC 33800]